MNSNMSYTNNINNISQMNNNMNFDFVNFGNNINKYTDDDAFQENQFSPFSRKDQEDFMHLIYDVVHVGVSIDSMKIRLESMVSKYGSAKLQNILNTPMKNEKYSSDFILPLKKIIYQDKNFQSDEEFFKSKLEMMKLFKSYGVGMIDIDKNELEMLLEMNLIDESIKNYILSNGNNYSGFFLVSI